MVKILRILNRFNLGGPTYNAGYLTKYLGDDFETILIGGRNGDYEESSSFILDQLKVDYQVIPEIQREINPLKDYVAYKKIRDIIKREKPDIVHTHAAKAGMLGRLAAVKEGVPIVVHTFHGHVFHSYFNKYKTKFFINLEKYLAKKSDKIIAISPRQKYEIKNFLGVDDKKITTIPIGIDVDKFIDNFGRRRDVFRRQYGLEREDIAIGIVGRLVPVKNHKMFIKAFSLLKRYLQNSIPVKAFIVGDGELKNELISLSKELGLRVWHKGQKLITDADVYFTSWIKDVENVYSGLDIVALSSLNEGTPITLIEAQASNRPVVSTNVGGVADTIIEGKTGLLSQSKDVYGFYYNMLQLVIDEKKRIIMGNAGYNFVKSKYDFNILVNNVRSLYESLLAEKSIRFINHHKTLFHKVKAEKVAVL
jgi:glycosyltransferase involved in cell wall biosynthesis